MPRKKGILKNRFCKRSKLDEDAFRGLFHCYLKHLPASTTSEFMADSRGVKISRQSVNKYFLNFGYHLYINFYYSDITLYLLKDELLAIGAPDDIFNGEGEIQYTYGFDKTKQIWLDGQFKFNDAQIREHNQKVLKNSNEYKKFLDVELSEDQVVELTRNGYQDSSLRHNMFIISVLRVINRLNYGFEEKYFESFFGKAYFCDIQTIHSNRFVARPNAEAIQAWLGKPWNVGEVFYLTNLVFGQNPMTLQTPDEYIKFMEENMGLR